MVKSVGSSNWKDFEKIFKQERERIHDLEGPRYKFKPIDIDAAGFAETSWEYKAARWFNEWINEDSSSNSKKPQLLIYGDSNKGKSYFVRKNIFRK